jgi:hypothetical protein
LGAFVDATVVRGRGASVVLVVVADCAIGDELVVVEVIRGVVRSVVATIGWFVVTLGVELDAVRVKTRTSSKRGLDHVTQ